MRVTYSDHWDAEVKQRPGELKEVGDNLGGRVGSDDTLVIVRGRLAQRLNITRRGTIKIIYLIHL